MGPLSHLHTRSPRKLVHLPAHTLSSPDACVTAAVPGEQGEGGGPTGLEIRGLWWVGHGTEDKSPAPSALSMAWRASSQRKEGSFLCALSWTP